MVGLSPRTRLHLLSRLSRGYSLKVTTVATDDVGIGTEEAELMGSADSGYLDARRQNAVTA